MSYSNQRTLYVATGNKGKLRDFATAAAENLVVPKKKNRSEWTIATLPGLSSIPAPIEDDATFEGNARLKAIYYAQHIPGAWVLADDSGLEVDVLGGSPGVYSARYAEKMSFDSASSDSMGTDDRNNACLLAELARQPDETVRTARYRCVLAVACDGIVLATADGSVEGEIMATARGVGGFGYDPLFLIPHLDKTMAELTQETRLGISHRGAALRKLLPLLPS